MSPKTESEKAGAGLRLKAETTLPTRKAGTFRLQVYGDSADQNVVVALVKGRIDSGAPALARLHSQCLTGDVFGSERCDCGEQLDAALAMIEQAGSGVLIYMFDEGRGIGLLNKIRAYALQAEGKDTVEANLALGFAADLRSYELAAQILRDLGVRSVALMTNNPEKVAGLEKAGVRVARRVPHWGAAHEHNADYLEVKKTKLGHEA